MYNSASTIRQGAKANTDAKVLKTNLALNWTRPYKVVAVGPCSSADTPDGSPLGCKRCDNRYDSSDKPEYLPAGLIQYVLNNFSKKSPPYHVTQDDVSAPLERLEVEKITGHQSLRGRGGVIAVL